MERESFKSRLGFILVAAGCAIGIGNVWKFPFLVGQNGGGIFVLFYLLSLILMGIPILTMELSVGRASRRTALSGYKALEPKGSKWHLHGFFCFFGCLMLMMYYTTVSGWMLNYFCKFTFGSFAGVTAEGVSGVFNTMLASPAQMLIGMGATVLFGFIINSFGIQKGLEAVSKVMMIGLLLLIVVLAIHSLILPNAMEGVKFYLLPSLENVQQQGLGHVITAAMNQAFFTLSLGIGAMEIFGSYTSDKYTLGGEAIRICILDTIVAFSAGLIIFPACFSYNVQPDAGPSLIFLTLPHVFLDMPGGRFWGAAFFLFMTFASFSTVLAVFENLLSGCLDEFHWTRKKATIVCLLVVLVTSIPCALGYNILSDIKFFGGKDILDSEDFIVSNFLLPLGALVYLLFCVSKWGWGFDKYIAEANKGEGFKIPLWFKNYFRFVLPILILVIFIEGLI
jgi:neurotransmitter:Na+ symporter, NSS family